MPSKNHSAKEAGAFFPAIAIETSRQPGAVSLALSATDIRQHELPDGGDLASHLLPALDTMITQAGVDKKTIKLVVVGVGPGSFTGLRSGAAVAAVLARFIPAPLVAISSLAGSPLLREKGLVALCLDALRDEVQGAVFQDGKILVAPTLTTPAGFNGILRGLPGSATNKGIIGGSGTKTLLEQAKVPSGWQVSRDTAWEPRADILLQQGLLQAQAGDFCPPEKVEPLYLRPSAAEEKK